MLYAGIVLFVGMVSGCLDGVVKNEGGGIAMLCCHFLRLERHLLMLLRLLCLWGINPSQICDRKSSPCMTLVPAQY